MNQVFCCALIPCDLQLLYYVPFLKDSDIFVTGLMFKILNMLPWTTKPQKYVAWVYL